MNFEFEFEFFSLVYWKELPSLFKLLHCSFEKDAKKHLPVGVFGNGAGIVLGTVVGVVRGTEGRSKIIFSHNKFMHFTKT